MFNRIKNFIRDTRIRVNFPAWERAALEKHTAEADRRFDTRQLEREVAAICERTRAAQDEKFGATAAALEVEQAATDAAVRFTEQRIGILSRDYRGELNGLYAAKNARWETIATLNAEMERLHGESAEASRELSEAYDDLEAAKSSVNAWHRKSTRSPWMLGNGGRELPKHSLFRQSFGDLDGYKRDRGAAGDAIGEAKDARDDVRARMRANRADVARERKAIHEINDSIRDAKAARQQMFDLKRAGERLSDLRRQLHKRRALQEACRQRVQALDAEMLEFRRMQDAHQGLGERQKEIAMLKARHERFVQSFNDPGMKEARRAAHRAEWMRQHPPRGGV
jgi:chromosome segregation ATPase